MNERIRPAPRSRTTSAPPRPGDPGPIRRLLDTTANRLSSSGRSRETAGRATEDPDVVSWPTGVDAHGRARAGWVHNEAPAGRDLGTDRPSNPSFVCPPAMTRRRSAPQPPGGRPTLSQGPLEDLGASLLAHRRTSSRNRRSNYLLAFGLVSGLMNSVANPQASRAARHIAESSSTGPALTPMPPRNSPFSTIG